MYFARINERKNGKKDVVGAEASLMSLGMMVTSLVGRRGFGLELDAELHRDVNFFAAVVAPNLALS